MEKKYRREGFNSALSDGPRSIDSQVLMMMQEASPIVVIISGVVCWNRFVRFLQQAALKSSQPLFQDTYQFEGREEFLSVNIQISICLVLLRKAL